METEALKPMRVNQIIRELWIWAKISTFLCGVLFVGLTIAQNMGAEIEMSTSKVPVLLIPNTVLVDPTPLPRK